MFMDDFKVVSPFKPSGDQPQAIEKLAEGLKNNLKHQVLLGVTGSGKTFTIAKTIEQTQLPALVISHNKTLAGQLYQELKEFFPHNPVSYFVSYYDYYQPEAYIPQSDTYIAKEVEINDLIDQLRLEATSNIFSYSRSIIVASVSCIYNIGSPQTYKEKTFMIKVGDKLDLFSTQQRLLELYYENSSNTDFLPGTFRHRGTRLDVFLAYSDDKVIRLSFDSNSITKIELQTERGKTIKQLDSYAIYPAKHYLSASTGNLTEIFKAIKLEAKQQEKFFLDQGKLVEAQRIRKRVDFDLSMIKETGYVNGIENYSRYFDGRNPGDPPFSLLDYFQYQYGQNFLVVIDESHATIPQVRGMYHGDKMRKQNLVDFGFRLPSAFDNRPLNFKEFLSRVPQAIYVSATPDEWEISKSHGAVIEQLIRPTGLVDSPIIVKQADKQIANLIEQIKRKKAKNERVLVITLTKRLAEDIASYLNDPQKTGLSDLKVAYLHSDIETLKRQDILDDLRKGSFDVLVGINLLREGLDLPEVSLVAILEADKEGFLRSKTSLIQIMGRAARHIAGEVILYADRISGAMQQAIDEVARRRTVQLAYNKAHGITPQSIKKAIRPRIIEKELEIDEEITDYSQLTPLERKKLIKKLEKQMREYAKIFDFEKAVEIRDKIEALNQ
jgi:excinuclease ABC subunit B